MQTAILIDRRRTVAIEPRDDLTVGGVHRGSMLAEQRTRIIGQVQRVHPGLTGTFPRGPGQQLGSRVTPSRRVRGKDVAVLEMSMELLEQAQRVGGPVDSFRWAALAIDQPLPPATDEIVVDLTSIEPARGQFRLRRHQLGEGLHRR
ncbi:hypothetical protein, partial [Streptomyces omiyaensis]|uniref:hypothetical protein n=1 Tax=Streptomyces omiyaensis TaxID=68247 RepID=UPI0036F8DA32